MLLLFKSWFKNLKTQWKIVLIVFLCMIFYISFLTIKLAKTEYNLWKEIKQDYIEAQKVIIEKEKNEEQIIKKASKNNENAIKQSKKIDEKLKQDEKIIDDSDVTNDERQRYISKYKG